MRNQLYYVLFLVFVTVSAHAEYRILAFGDSNTWGWKPMGGGERFTDAKRWTGVMAAQLGDDYTVITDGLVARRTDLDGLDTKLVEGSFLNGAKTLPPAIIRNAPVDLVILFLGTNDLQLGAERSAQEVAASVAGLANLVADSGGLLYSAYDAPPEVWIVAPPALGDLSGTPLEGLFSVGVEASKQLSSAFQEMAASTDLKVFYCDQILDGAVGADGIHLTEAGHAKLGLAIAAAFEDAL